MRTEVAGAMTRNFNVQAQHRTPGAQPALSELEVENWMLSDGV